MPPRRAALSDLIRSPHFRFAAAFGLSCLGLQALFCVLPDALLKVICEHTALVLGRVLNTIGFPVVVRGTIVSGSGIAFQIVLECTALSTVALFACFVAFYPAGARKKAIGLAMGIPALYIGNLVRLVAVFAVSHYNPRLFEIAHAYLGQVFTILLVVLACLLWLKWVNTGSLPGRVSKAAGFLARFVLLSGSMFLFWMEVHHWYVWFLDRFMIFGFSLFGYHLLVPPETAVYYETFSIVAFVSLILATQSVKWSTKAKVLVVGLGLFFLLHLFHRVDTALLSAFHFTSLFRLDVLLCDLGQYLLPMLLWLVMVIRRPAESPSRGADEGRMAVRRKKQVAAPSIPSVKAP